MAGPGAGGAPPPDGGAAAAGLEPWRGELVAYVRRLGAGPEAEDVVQEAVLRALREPPPRRLGAWLRRVALNLMRDRRRKERGLRSLLARVSRPSQTPEPGPAAVAEAKEEAARAWAAVRSLPERQRLSLFLRVRCDMEYDGIGTALGCSAATARQHFHLAVRAVRRRLAGGAHE